MGGSGKGLITFNVSAWQLEFEVDMATVVQPPSEREEETRDALSFKALLEWNNYTVGV